jgi:hypothetical protein
MKTKRSNLLLVTTVTMILIPFSLSAETAVAGYVEGLVEFNDGGGWSDVFIGDSLSLDGQLRIDSGAYVELMVGGATVRLSRPGIVDLGDIDRGSAPAGVTGAIAGRMGRFLQPDETRTQTAVGGVRASEAVSEPEISWAGGEDSQELIEQGLEYLAVNDFEEAYYSFEEAYDFAGSGTEEEAGFFFAYAAFVLGETDTALDVLSEIEPDADSPVFLDATLLQAQMLLETGDADGTVRAADRVISQRGTLTEQDPLSLQLAYFLRAEALSGTGDQSGARQAYARARDLAPETQIGRSANGKL